MFFTKEEEANMKKMLLSFTVAVAVVSMTTMAWGATKINALPYTISSPGTYKVVSDLTAVGDGITILADNVTLDLQRHILTGNGTGKGVFIKGVNVEVANGTVDNFQHGVYNRGASQSGAMYSSMARIINIRATNNLSLGIHSDEEGCLIKDSSAYNNHIGIEATDCVVQGNVVYNNTSRGIEAYGSLVTDNYAAFNGGNGIYASRGSLKNNVSRANGAEDIYLVGQSLVEGNAVNKSDGMNACPTCTFGTNHIPAP